MSIQSREKQRQREANEGPRNVVFHHRFHKNCVEAMEFADFVDQFGPNNHNPMLKHAMGNVEISFTGYADDPRELFQIPEMLAFVKKLNEAWPYCFYFLSTNQSEANGWGLLQFVCMLTFDKAIWREDKQCWEQLWNKHEYAEHHMGRHFDAMNQLFDKVGFTEEQNKIRSRKINECINGTPPPAAPTPPQWMLER